MASSIETTSTTTTLKNNGNTYMSVDTNDDVAITNTLTATSPTFVTPALGTPASGTLTNCSFPTLNQNTSGTAAGLSATLAVGSGGTGVTSSTGSGNNVLSASPTLTGTLTTAAITASGNILQSKAGNTELMTLNTNGTVKGGLQALSNQSIRVGSTTNYPTEIVVNNAAKLTVGTNGVVTLAAPLPVASGGTGTTGGSGWVKLATTGDITSGTSLTIDNCFSTTYHKYRFVYDVTNGGASSGNNYVAFRLRTGGASGADLTSTYHYRATRGYSGHANVEIAAHDRNYVNDNYNRLDKPQHGVIDIFRYPLFNKPVYFDYQCIGTHPSNDECFPTKIQGVNHTDATSITGLKLYLYSGETSSAWTGRMTVYGAIR
jgi:hypothetical protein